MSDECLPKCLLMCLFIKGSHAASGQKSRWDDIIVRDLKLCGLTDDWSILAKNRNEWRNFIKQQVRVMNDRAEQEENNTKMSGSNGGRRV